MHRLSEGLTAPRSVLPTGHRTKRIHARTWHVSGEREAKMCPPFHERVLPHDSGTVWPSGGQPLGGGRVTFAARNFGAISR